MYVEGLPLSIVAGLHKAPLHKPPLLFPSLFTAEPMACTNLHSSFCCFFFWLLSSTLSFHFLQGTARAETVSNQYHHHDVSVSFLLPTATKGLGCSLHKAPTQSAALLTVTHRHGPCSPISSDEKAASMEEVLSQDQSRVSWIRSKISKTSSNSKPTRGSSDLAAAEISIPARSGRSLSTGNFVVTVGFGTPKKDMTVAFDTGSDLTWIQCEPCAVFCYSQQEKIFDPSQSTTYSNFSCNSHQCSQLASATSRPPACSSSTCVYAISYGDQSYSVGFFSHETLTVGTSDAIPYFQFGCGQRNRGLFGSTAGLLGLGRNKISFPSQTAKKYGNLFSYCLPSSPTSTGYLAFGRGRNGNGNGNVIKYTPLLTDHNNPSFYFLQLIAISVGGIKLAIPQSVFSTAGTLIDSGTVITRLPPSAYQILRSAFRKAMSKYPSAPAFSILDTCFDLNGYSLITVPKIALFFRGYVQIDVPLTGILLVGSGQSQICLAFAGNTDSTDTAIIGNKQQQTLDVVYDVAGSRIGFGAGGCS